jgi:hypothetical protein
MGNFVNILNEFDLDKWSVVFEDDYFKFFSPNNQVNWDINTWHNGLIFSKIKQSFLYDKPLGYKYSLSEKLLELTSRYNGKEQLVNLQGDFLLDEWERIVDSNKLNDKFIIISIKSVEIGEPVSSICTSAIIQPKMANVWNTESQSFVFDEWATTIFISDNHICFYDETKGYRIYDENCNLVSDKWFEDCSTLGYTGKTCVLSQGKWFYFDENDDLIHCNENDSNILNECNNYQNNKTIIE